MNPAAVVGDHALAILVLKEDGLKQPYQALVIRQGARLFQGIECHGVKRR